MNLYCLGGNQLTGAPRGFCNAELSSVCCNCIQLGDHLVETVIRFVLAKKRLLEKGAVCFPAHPHILVRFFRLQV